MSKSTVTLNLQASCYSKSGGCQPRYPEQTAAT